MTKRNVFVVGLDPFNQEKLENLPQADEVSFYPALGVEDIREVERFDMAALIEKAVAALQFDIDTAA